MSVIECSICVNSARNPTTPIGVDGLCPICRTYRSSLPLMRRQNELAFVKSLIDTRVRFDAMVGMSGGKDSTAAAFLLKEMGFNPLGFTFDIGYYPKHIFTRAKEYADKIGIEHCVIDIRDMITPSSIDSYKRTADFYDDIFADAQIPKEKKWWSSDSIARERFHKIYQQNRDNYSVKKTEPMVYVRSCILCRKTVIPSYFREAMRRGIMLVVLGINEWAALSKGDRFPVSAIRKLQPLQSATPVYVVHLPFLLAMTKQDVEDTLYRVGWYPPEGESLIESNANSCLFAAATQEITRDYLGFHPDSTRLAREVTVGFMSREDAVYALSKTHNSNQSVRDVLRSAGVI